MLGMMALLEQLTGTMAPGTSSTPRPNLLRPGKTSQGSLRFVIAIINFDTIFLIAHPYTGFPWDPPPPPVVQTVTLTTRLTVTLQPGASPNPQTLPR